ncbi:MAG: Starvation sensing protein RspA [uncultured Chloroflexi bacterium]|uniref:Starvation sensing protein RspA n=1 Tax=uncultured Chloroflexota bacterium TaxID=166587 RepID=A0A6J4JR89_9CHLR|nr:MAG: Starvation sensing protein RspA [uncultured Chloroflexota bacterium]
MPAIHITDVRSICTAPDGIRLVVVKIETSEPGLYGVGCATFTQRARAVHTAVDEYLRPFLIGRDPNDIEDIWQAANVSGYWRSGPVLNNALSGVDQALWDIKGKRAGMPVHQLLGGKCRRAADVYVHCAAPSITALEELIERRIGEGYRVLRANVPREWLRYPEPTVPAEAGGHWEPRAYARAIVRLFDRLRGTFGDRVELLHDVHERIPPIQAIQLAKDLESYHPFFFEDPLAPEDGEYFRIMREQSSVPIAMGELFVNLSEYLPLIRDRLIDYMRVHVSDIGGLTPARKLAALCEFFGVRTAWHGPGDVSPVGHAAQLQLDLSCHNFGIQEGHPGRGERTREVFHGIPEVHDGAMWANDGPGLGVDIDERAAARYPFPHISERPLNGSWYPVRLRDGTAIRP